MDEEYKKNPNRKKLMQEANALTFLLVDDNVSKKKVEKVLNDFLKYFRENNITPRQSFILLDLFKKCVVLDDAFGKEEVEKKSKKKTKPKPKQQNSKLH